MNIVFMSKWAIENLINPRKNWALISIREKGENVNLSKDWSDILEVEFDDLVPEECELMSDRVSAIMGREPDFFDSDDANKILDFAKKINDSEELDTVVVHCHAGVSRSGAVAKFLSEKYGVRSTQRNEAYNPHVYNILKGIDKEE